MAAKASKTKKKLERAVVYLEPEQLRALRVEAARVLDQGMVKRWR